MKAQTSKPQGSAVAAAVSSVAPACPIGSVPPEVVAEHERKDNVATPLIGLMKIALIGNPNSGKTTLFNELTGANQHVGNWPGVTVEQKTGQLRAKYAHHVRRGQPKGQEQIEVVDLPGIYSLSPFSLEEVIARDYIIKEQPDVVVDIVDGTNLERNLYLSVQLMELDVPLVLAINMMDQVESDGKRIDIKQLERDFGVQVVPISAANHRGVEELMEACAQASSPTRHELPDPALERMIALTEHLLHDHLDAEHLLARNPHNDFSEYTKMGYPLHWMAVKVLESDELVLQDLTLDETSVAEINKLKDDFESSNELICTAFANARYGFIQNVIDNGMTDVQEPKRQRSDRVDRILTNKYLAIPIFLIIMLLMFHLTFSDTLFGIPGLPSPGIALQDLVQRAVNAFTGLISPLFVAGSWSYGLVVDGIIGGVGSVLSFVPQILLLFLFLSLLEDCGYMARAAFVMNNLFKRFGLSGKSALPMLMGFGCNVPAAMACRTLDNEQERNLTLMLIPFMSCGARAPIFLAFAGAFFPSGGDFIIWGLYLLGIVVALVSGVILKKTLFKGDANPFIIELPRYRVPGLKTTALTLWEKLKDYVVRAGTIIFVMSIVVWFLSNFGWTDGSFGMVADISGSILAMVGQWIAVIFTPLGFGFWGAAVALLSGFIAKESVVATFGVLTSSTGATAGAGQLVSASGLMALGFTPLSAASFMVFCLLYIPCMAAVATFAREFHSAKWTAFQIIYTCVVAYLVSFLVYGIGTLVGL